MTKMNSSASVSAGLEADRHRIIAEYQIDLGKTFSDAVKAEAAGQTRTGAHMTKKRPAKPTPRTPQDATTRNVRASQKRDDALAKRLDAFEARLERCEAAMQRYLDREQY